MSIATGVVGDKSISCYHAVSIGKEAIARVVGKYFGNIKLSRKERALPLASMIRSIKISDMLMLIINHTFRVSQHNLTYEKEEDQCKIEGYRFVEMNYFLKKALSLQSLHNIKCTSGKLEYSSEKRSGLVSVYTLKCNICDREEHLATEKPQTSEEKSNNHSTINTAAVWCTLSTGSSYTHLTESLSVMNVPPLGGTVFFKIQRELGDAVIIRKRTGKILFLGIRNKYCSICARNKHKSLSNGTHFKNYDGPSSSVEADIVIEGFNSSIAMHGVRYKKFGADRDSTVYSRIKQQVSYGHEIQVVLKFNVELNSSVNVLIAKKSASDSSFT
ncbi:hypothetical protein ILUMI_08863 [Ignelater luminosus]|uniref:Mutator-like transposase domain-containing protein n=1 Tax=Ignelater luminosus TaxID=2038154 RepID=A0A8K0D4Z0_IGNLU|nr:hypothetical protein ILUMI_08863 [Ignelater luminosus]